MNYFKFEIKRILSSRKNKILFLIASLLVLALIVNSGILVKGALNIKRLETNISRQISFTHQNLQDLKEGDNSDIPKNVLADMIKDGEERLKLYNEQSTALQNKDLTQYYKSKLKINEINLGDNQEQYQDMSSTKDENSYIKDVLSKKLEFELFPQAQLHAFGVAHVGVFSLLASSLFLIIFMLIGGISLATDFENEQMKLYKTPVFRGENIVLTTFTANVTVMSIWYLLAIIVYIVSVGLMNGFGALNYPSAIPGLNLMENGKIDLLYLLWGLLMIVFVTAFGTWISLILKRSSVVVAFFAILVLGYEMIKNQEFLKEFLQFLPMTYFNPLSLLKGADYLPKDAILVGVIYLLGLSVVFLVLASISYKKLSFRKLENKSMLPVSKPIKN